MYKVPIKLMQAHTHSHTLKKITNCIIINFYKSSSSGTCCHTTAGVSVRELALFPEQSEVQEPKPKQKRIRNARSIPWSSTAQCLPLRLRQVSHAGEAGAQLHR